MYRLILLVLLGTYVVSCSPKLATKSTSEDYSEDVSAYRPTVMDSEAGEDTNVETSSINKGPYVAPTHDIQGELVPIMDSIVVHNRDKMYRTYTIQVYIGRSREEANQIREKVYRILPDEEPVLIYKQPSYKVNVGKYFDKVDAYKTLNMLKSNFTGAMLVPERNLLD